MPAPITSLYAALLAILFIALSAGVVSRRRAAGAAFGFAGDAALERAARVHGNFAEYVPFALLLMALVEGAGYAGWVPHLLGIVLVAGRAAHAHGVSRTPEDLRFRVAGVACTLTVLGLSALLLLAASVLGLRHGS